MAERLDARLVRVGIASGREKAKQLIASGAVTVNGKVVTKAACSVEEFDRVESSAPPPRYVGRGGEKLEKAIKIASLSLQGAVAMDIGASTGGFTDCMLQNGAAHVYAVDVGHGQLHPSLRADARVTCLEGTDCRNTQLLMETVAAESISFCSVDVSFISLQAVLPSLSPFLAKEATVVCLIKPQFEAGKRAVGKKGVVKDKRDHMRVINEQLALFASLGYTVNTLTYSPIVGGEGNIEYLAVLSKGASSKAIVQAAFVVEEAFRALK